MAKTSTKLNKEISDNISKLINILKEKNTTLKELYLFGSFAKGKEGSNSDIDIAVVLDEVHDVIDEQMRLMKIGCRIDSRFEIHPFDETSFKSDDPFVSEIKASGIKIL